VCGYDGEGIDGEAFGDEVLGIESNSGDGVRAGWAALVSGEAEILSLVFWSRASPPILLRRTDKRTNDYLCARITASWSNIDSTGIEISRQESLQGRRKRSSE